MRNKKMQLIGATLAAGVLISSVFGIGLQRKNRKECGCRLARAEVLEEYADKTSLEGFEGPELVSATEKEKTKIGLFTDAKAAYVMERESGASVFEKEAKKHLPIASMCKIMTLILAFEAIDSGVITMDEEILISENAASMGGSQVFLEAHAKYPVRELLKSIVVCSANDSCVAIAERVAGSDALFVERMNERAKELGCEDTLFANCTGLPKEPQYSCAKDVATMLSTLLNHPQYYEFGKIWTDTFHHPEGRTTEISNTNRLTRFYDGCDGGKTGFTSEAGFCLAATAKRGDMRVISVIIGASDSKKRFKQVAESFDYTFANFKLETVVDERKEWESSIYVSGGKEKSLAVKPARGGRLFLRRGEKGEYELKAEIPSTVKAPVKQGDIVGEVYVIRGGVEVDRIPLVATTSIDKAGYFDVLRDVANDWKIH